MARSGPTRSLPWVASQVYSSSVRPSSGVTVRRAATISGSGVGSAGGPAMTGCLPVELLCGKQAFVAVQSGHSQSSFCCLGVESFLLVYVSIVTGVPTCSLSL